MPDRLTHEEYLERLFLANPNIDIVENYINSGSRTKHKCKMCGHTWSPRPRDVLRGHGCPLCSGKIVGPAPEYRNSIWASEYREYFSKYLTESQMKQYTPQSSVQVEALCPNCGLHKNVMISNLHRYGIGCICQDGVSFPNKFVFNVLQQLKVVMKPEYSPGWAQKRKYDLYLSDYQVIIENHGGQHYINNEKRGFARTLEEEQENDLFKYHLAMSNGIINYIVLDCRNSDKEWIKASIMNSMLPTLLHFKEEDVDWDMALLYASTSIIGKHRSTVCRWLSLATQLGLCNYQPQNELVVMKSKKIRCIETDIIFDSVRKAAAFIGQSSTSIVNCLKGKTHTSGGYHWEYV